MAVSLRVGTAEARAGEFARAAALYEECRALDNEIGDRMGYHLELLGLGSIARDLGDPVSVRRYNIPSLAFFRELSIHWAVCACLNNLALAAYFEGDLTAAYRLTNESVTLIRGLNDDAGLAEPLVTLGKVLRAQGHRAAARETLTEALQLAPTYGPRLMVAAALEGLACTESPSEQAAWMVRLLSAAHALRTQMGTPVRPIDQPELDHTLSLARSVLADSTFTAIWEKPQPLEQILPRAG